MTNPLRVLRKKKKLTLMALAAKTGSTPSWLTFVERYGHIPGPELRQRIADALGGTVTDLWPGLTNDERESDTEHDPNVV